MVKKLSDDKPDDPRLGFCDFLKVEVVQLTSDLYDEFQQETFNLVMRLKHSDKQQQRYRHVISTNMAQTATYSQASTSHQYPLSQTQMQTPQQQMQHIFTHVTSTSTAAAFTTFTAALSTDIYPATCTSSTADPRPGSTAEHAVTALHASDVSTTAVDAAATAGDSTTSAKAYSLSSQYNSSSSSQYKDIS